MSRPRGTAQVDLAQRLGRAAQEGVETSDHAGSRGGALMTLSPEALKQTIAAAVEAAFTRFAPAPAPADGEGAQAARGAEVSAVLTELRGMINQVASPAQGRTVVAKKTKRYELGLSTSREKARRCSRRSARRRSAYGAPCTHNP